MKLALPLLLSLSICQYLHSQSCEQLDKYKFFNPVSLGETLPEDLAMKSKMLGNTYYINIDTLTRNEKKKYSELFSLLGMKFSRAQVHLNNKKIETVEMWAVKDFIDSNNLKARRPRPEFDRFLNKLTTRFGKPVFTRMQNIPEMEEEVGITNSYYWHCYNIRLTVQLTYGGKAKYNLNNLIVIVRDLKFDVPQEVMRAE